MEMISKHSSTSSGNRLPVVVSPHGMRGSLSGCCPGDLVKQVYFSSGKVRASNGIIGLPHQVSQRSSCQLRGQNCYLEVTLGCASVENDKTSVTNKNNLKHHLAESPATARDVQKGSADQISVYERTFIYPPEAVLVPVVQTSFSRSSLKRFWLQNWMGPSLSGSSIFMHCSDGKVDSVDGSWLEPSSIRSQHGYHNSSSNSNSSSISSISTSSDSDYKMNTGGTGDLEADADSLTCRQSGLSSADQFHNGGLKMGSKRPRSGITESYSQAGGVINANMHDPYKSDYGSMEVSNSAITGLGNDQIGWDWDDDDRAGGGMDIQALLSEFGDFGDFFENDVLPFGEPPGTAESQALVFSTPDCGDIVGSPSTGMMDVSDQMLLPVGFPSFDSFNPAPPVMEEPLAKNQEVTNNIVSSISNSYNTPQPCTTEFDYLIKAEALMTFAPEYGAVETPASEFSSTIFRSPYIPQSRKVESANSSSSNYVYSATPPSPCIDGSDEKPSMSVNAKVSSGSKKYYNHVDGTKEKNDRNYLNGNSSIASREGPEPSPFSTHAVNSVHRKMIEGSSGTGNLLRSMKTVLANEIECIMFQAFMCKIRHTLISSSNPPSVSLNRLSGSTVLNPLHGDTSIMADNISSKYEVKKKESIPVRIAGDLDGGMLDGPLHAPVGVWRTVGVSKGSKPSTPSMEVCPSLSHNSFNEEAILSYGQRQPLMELLNGMALLVQQATSFVDVALDADCGDGPYGCLALQEQWRRGFSCGPSMVHAGCGGVLASCHSLDIAGVELVDPLSVDVNASSAISLLQSDIKMALKSAFGTLDGPLSVTDWCKGRSQSGDVGTVGDGFSGESSASASECRDSSSTLSVGEPISPSQSSVGGSSSVKDETSERRSSQEACTSESDQQMASRLRPTLFVLPFPAILVGYQDDWLKTSASSLQLWEKAPLEPYAMQKHMTYYVVCPDIDPLTAAAADFFQQLGTVYETCKLGTHSPQSMGNQMEIDSGKWSSSGFVPLDCPQSMKIESSSASLVGSISDYFLSLSNGWDLTSYLKSLVKVLKTLKLGSCLSTNPKEGSSGPCMVIYVVCPFPEPTAVLKTIVESSAALGSVIVSSDKERRTILHSQVGKALSCSTAVDEASISNIVTLSGFSIPKLVLQIVTVDAIFRVTSPSLNELVILKEIAFTVYNKARRISRGCSSEVVPSSFITGRSNSSSMQMTSSPISGMWKDCIGPRITGQRDGELDASLRTGPWDNSWQMSRTGGLGSDPNRTGDIHNQDEIRYMFEPLFILAEPGSLDRGVSPPLFGNLACESSKMLLDDGTSTVDGGPSNQLDGSDLDGFGSGHQKTVPSLHCCYGWTEDWRWLVCVWTDSRGELLDSYIFPFGGISSRQDTKGLQFLFVQILQKGCQILQACSPDTTGIVKPRDFVVTRIGCYFELECQEWQKALYSIGGSEVKKWALQLRRSLPDGMPSSSSNGATSLQQEMSLIEERTLLPSSPSPLYSSSHTKSSSSTFMKGGGGGLGQPPSSARKQQLMGGGHNNTADNSRGGLLQWVQSISFVSISVDHSLQLVLQADSTSPGPGTSQGSGTMGQSSYLEGFTPVKSLGSTSASYILIPSPSMRFLPPTPLQLPTCLKSESPPLAHLLHSKGSAIPLSTGFVVSKSVPSMRKDSSRINNSKVEEWPSVLSVNLVDYYGGHNNNNLTATQEKMVVKGKPGGGRSMVAAEGGGGSRDIEVEMHLILESVAAELHALSWMTVSPAYLERRTSLPFHCDMVLRLRRLLHFADKELSRQPDKSEP
ncbi:hypothetical protein LguiA_012963 [Lonicera macranthoides]